MASFWRDVGGDIAGGLTYILDPAGGAASKKKAQQVAGRIKDVKPGQQLVKGGWGDVARDVGTGAALAAPFVAPAAGGLGAGAGLTGEGMPVGAAEAAKLGELAGGGIKSGLGGLTGPVLAAGGLGAALKGGIGGKKGKKGAATTATDQEVLDELKKAGFQLPAQTNLSPAAQAYLKAHPEITPPVTPQPPMVDPLAMQSFWANSIAPMLQGLSGQVGQTADQYGQAMQGVASNPNLPPAYQALIQAQVPQQQQDMRNVAGAEEGAALGGAQYDQMVQALNQALQQQYKTQLAGTGGGLGGLGGIP